MKEREREGVRHNREDLTNGPQKGGETLSHLFVVGATVAVGATAMKKQQEREESVKDWTSVTWMLKRSASIIWERKEAKKKRSRQYFLHKRVMILPGFSGHWSPVSSLQDDLWQQWIFITLNLGGIKGERNLSNPKKPLLLLGRQWPG